MPNEINFKQIRRSAHSRFVMPVEAKNVRNQHCPQVRRRHPQPEFIIFPTKPADLEELVVVAAEGDELWPVKQGHRVDVRMFDQHPRIPVEVGEKTTAIARLAAKAAKNGVGGGGAR